MSSTIAEAHYAEVIIADYCHIAAAALLVYDCLLTLSSEVQVVWRRRFTAASLLFFVNRYCALLDKMMILLELLKWTGQTDQRYVIPPALPSSVRSINCSCTVIVWIDAILVVTNLTVITIFSVLRAYALSERRWTPALLVLCFGLALPAASLYLQTTYTTLAMSIGGCGSSSSMSLTTYRILATAARSASIASDLLVLFVTFTKTIGIRKFASSSGIRTGIVDMILRDGTLYFIVLLFFNVGDIIFLQVAINGAVADIVTTLSVILISRFLLNLRAVGMDASASEDASGSPTSATPTSVLFANSVVAALGAPLEHETDTELRNQAGATESIEFEDGSDVQLEMRACEIEQRDPPHCV